VTKVLLCDLHASGPDKFIADQRSQAMPIDITPLPIRRDRTRIETADAINLRPS